MNMNAKLKELQAKIKDRNLIEGLDKALTDVAFVDQGEVNIKQLTWDRDIDENVRIVIMTEDDYDKYCDVINSAHSILHEIAGIPPRKTLEELLENEPEVDPEENQEIDTGSPVGKEVW